jgi:hypothetical protein
MKENFGMRDSGDDWLDYRSILDISYYVSPQLRISAYAGLHYGKRDYKLEYLLDYDPFYAMSKSESNSLNFNYGVNLIYKVF